MRVYVVHYSEIALKGKNRRYFEERLVENLRRKIRKIEDCRIRREYGRIVVESENPAISEVLRKTPGVKYSALAEVAELDVESICERALKIAPDAGTFKVDTRRSNKDFPLTSIEINRIVGERILKAKKLRVDLHNPDKIIYVEISSKHAYVYSERIEGIGGLPVGVSGRVVSLISGGIDSPVASFLAMKRGAEVVLVHFFNSTIHSQSVRKKIHDLAEKLSEVHRVRLYMVPFRDVQMEIIRCIPSDYRMVVYRRSMMRMASLIAEREGAKAIVTGDSLGQVASQTLQNLRTIYAASNYPVLTPLIGLDKDEIVEIARRIGTYDISTLPYEDCCSLLVSKHPITSAKLDEVERMEENCQLREKEAVESAEVIEFG
ncbi:tRNA sulfurtransferase ThiI [Geoglobus ahangari]|uniref:Probable tRNA sulfurtransferase n=1 Tax=Geoglobus ahangari TaxID=113653 RepID=A0A0F7ICS8_9EURY|nr:tRNA uracil 4-sulfurtransferase ThiI [Geoglobus ahangari]AKG90672.1 tRNA sulfurtransferase ThiI [Geoglobus ahangari]